jgi:hypothetical protein
LLPYTIWNMQGVIVALLSLPGDRALQRPDMRMIGHVHAEDGAAAKRLWQRQQTLLRGEVQP